MSHTHKVSIALIGCLKTVVERIEESRKYSIYIIAIKIHNEILCTPAWRNLQRILFSFSSLGFLWQWASSQHLAGY